VATLGIVLVVFVAIVWLNGMLDEPIVDLSAIGLGHRDNSVRDPGDVFSNISYSNGAVRVSMLKAVSDVLQTAQGTDWSSVHPRWYVYSCRSNSVDGSGLSRAWVVSLRADDSMLVATVTDNVVTGVTVYGSGEPAANGNEEYPEGSVDQYPDAASGAPINPARKVGDLLDTGRIMRLVLDETRVSPAQETALFAIDYSDTGELASYTVSFKDEAMPSRSFVVQMDAGSGHILRSDRGVSQ
jgi:hypothetical protein